MYDVVIYISSISNPHKATDKVNLLMSFGQGAEKLGKKVYYQHKHEYVPGKLAVMIGWVAGTINAPNTILRKTVIDQQKANGWHVMPIDANCWSFCDPSNLWLRYSLDGIWYNENNYANKNSSPERWEKIKSALNIDLQPWRSNGRHILVCLQRQSGWSMKGVDNVQWAIEKIKQIRQYSNRPIRVRMHPKAPTNIEALRRLGVEFSRPKTSILDDLRGAWACVLFSSSASVAAIQSGIPCFVDDNSCVAYAVSNTDISKIETPIMPDRTQWVYDLAACHWHVDESKEGLIYKHFEPYLG